jgi:hypothetical protein
VVEVVDRGSSDTVIDEEFSIYFMGLVGLVAAFVKGRVIQIAGSMFLVVGVILISVFADRFERLAAAPRLLRLTTTDKFTNLVRVILFLIVVFGFPIILYLLDDRRRIGGLTFFVIIGFQGVRSFYGVWKAELLLQQRPGKG